MQHKPNHRHKQLGQQGEALAASYLKQQGYQILFTNWRAGRAGEIDVIVERPPSKLAEGILVFVEVKTRRGNSQGHPLEAIDARKQRQMLKVAEAFLAQYPQYTNRHCLRFDAIGIEWPNPNQPATIQHLENIISL